MTDREKILLCAEAMGWVPSHWSVQHPDRPVHVLMRGEGNEHTLYDPISDDAQAMALIKRYPFTTLHAMLRYVGSASCVPERVERCITLNSAIVDAVAALQHRSQQCPTIKT